MSNFTSFNINGVDSSINLASDTENGLMSSDNYVELEELNKKTESIEFEKIVDTSQNIYITNDDETETIVEITTEYTNIKNLLSNDSSVITENIITEDYKIGKESINTIYDNIVIEDDNGDTVTMFTSDGIKTKGIFDLSGNNFTNYSNSVVYISPDGSDDNTGDSSNPKLTINSVIESGASDIILLDGVYDQTIDFTNAGANISIKGATGAKVIFKKSASLISNTGTETLVDNYTKVYMIEDVSDINYGTVKSTNWLFFDELNDVNTIIQPEDAHPVQRGLFYRNDCTKLKHTTATDLDSALTEIENTSDNEYKWFYDLATSILYFNRYDDTSVYPLYKSTGDYFITKENLSVHLSNIEFRYAVVNLNNLNSAVIENCASKYVYGSGAFTYNNSISIQFINCEASSCFRGSNGDGFNGHATTPIDISAKRCQVKLIDCWSHDNNDDGYSDHEYAETSIYGGLYEYNRKGGVTPSYGSHCSCNNVYSRHNYAGFYYTGLYNDNGNKGQMICYNCISEQNNRGGTKCGFNVDAEGNRMILYNCLAVNEQYGYSVDSSTFADLYDCRQIDCSISILRNGTINIYNGESLS